MSTMNAAIERLYEVFARYGRRGSVDGCPCCVGASDQARLHARPLRELGDEELGKYAFKALTTWGTEDDLRHFLPRILELVASGELWVGPQIVLGKLTYGGWERWPEAEREAIRAFLDAWLEQSMAIGVRLDEVLSSIHQTGVALAPCLERIADEAARSINARRALLGLARNLSHSRSLDPWTGLDASDQIARWLVDDERLALLLRATDELDDVSDRDIAQDDIDALLTRAGG